MYLRETRRRNGDGSVVSYLALAHNERDPETGIPKAKIIHNFGRADTVDKEALARLVRSISRFLDPAEALQATSASDGEIEVLDSRPMGPAWVADRLWERLGIGRAIFQVAAGRRLEAEAVERVIFSMVANRLSVKPLSKLAGCSWVAKRAFVDNLAEVTDDQCYRAMDFLLEALPELQENVFFSVANLMNLEVDLLFFDTSSTYFETERLEDELAGDEEDDGDSETEEEVDEPLEEAGIRRFSSHSKDHRRDLPQVVLGLAVTREGIPVRMWTFPGTTSDQDIIKKVKDDLGAWGLHRVIWCLDRGFNSADNRRYLTRAGGHYIVGEKLRSDQVEAKAALSRQGRYRLVAGNLRVKEVRVDDGVMRDRFVICHNPERATHDAAVRANIVAELSSRIAGSDTLSATRRAELYGKLSTKAVFKRFLRRTTTGKLRIDKAAITHEAHLDGKFLLRTDDESMSAEDIALGYKSLYEAERGWRDLKRTTVNIRPVYHRREDRIRAHVQLCWLALLVLRVAEIEVGDTWRNIRSELDRMHLVTMATSKGTVSQRSELTPGQRHILGRLELPEPPRFFDFTPAPDEDPAPAP
ncbi:MAG: IS1634 family transposase [Actinomycetota bacterium]|nr:IS1634 family transposase [Actinomycetota bacterium]